MPKNIFSMQKSQERERDKKSQRKSYRERWEREISTGREGESERARERESERAREGERERGRERESERAREGERKGGRREGESCEDHKCDDAQSLVRAISNAKRKLIPLFRKVFSSNTVT